MWRRCLVLALCSSSVLESCCVQLTRGSASNASKPVEECPVPSPTNPVEKFLCTHKPHLFATAGLEGAGVRIFQRLWKSSFVWGDDSSQHVLKFPREWICGERWAFNGFDVMKSRVGTVKVNDVWAVTFQATYPSCGVRAADHANRMKYYHPDLRWIQQASADSGAAHHIIFINRPIVDCLKLTCAVRRYEPCDMQAKTLLSNAEILKKQLLEIDQSDASCYNYESDDAVSAGVDEAFERGFPSMGFWFRERNISGIDRVPGASAADMEGLRRLTGELNEICRKMHQFTMKEYRSLIEGGHGDIKLLRTAPPTMLY